MIVGKKDIKDYFIKQGRKYFSIYRKGEENTGNPICKNEDIEGQQPDPESALNDFQDWLKLLQTGDYLLILNNVPKVSERGGVRSFFRIPLNESLANQVGDIPLTNPAVQGIGGTFTMEDVLAKAEIIAQKQYEALKAKDDLEKLKLDHATAVKDLAEAQKKLDEPWNKFIGALAPHADKFIPGLFGEKTIAEVVPFAPAALKVSGIPHDDHVHDNDNVHEAAHQETQKVFENFVEALQSARPNDWLQIIVKLTDIIKNNPQKFNTALNFL